VPVKNNRRAGFSATCYELFCYRKNCRTGIVRATPAVDSGAGNLAHGVVEGQTKNLDMEVNGIAGQIAFRPAPVAVFDDETGTGGQNKIARLARDQL